MTSFSFSHANAMIKSLVLIAFFTLVNCWDSYTVVNDGLCHNFPVKKNGDIVLAPSHNYALNISAQTGYIIYCTAADSTMYGVDEIKYTVTSANATIEDIIYVQLLVNRAFPPDSYDINVSLMNDSLNFVDVLLNCKDPNGNPDGNKIIIESGSVTLVTHEFTHLDNPYRSGTKDAILVPNQAQEIVYKIISSYSGLESYTSTIYVNV